MVSHYIPMVRKFAPFIAGIWQVNSHKFACTTFLGALLWVVPLVVMARVFSGKTALLPGYPSVPGNHRDSDYCNLAYRNRGDDAAAEEGNSLNPETMHRQDADRISGNAVDPLRSHPLSSPCIWI